MTAIWWRLFILEKNYCQCTGNEADNERSEVFNRLINCIDLVEIEARYHDKCRIQIFSTSQLAAVSDNP